MTYQVDIHTASNNFSVPVVVDDYLYNHASLDVVSGSINPDTFYSEIFPSLAHYFPDFCTYLDDVLYQYGSSEFNSLMALINAKKADIAQTGSETITNTAAIVSPVYVSKPSDYPIGTNVTRSCNISLGVGSVLSSQFSFPGYSFSYTVSMSTNQSDNLYGRYGILLNCVLCPSNFIANGVVNFSSLTTAYRYKRLSIAIDYYKTSGNISYSVRTYDDGAYTTSIINNYKTWNNIILTVPSDTTDPYIDVVGDTSTTGGGDGTGDFTGDTISESSIPTVTALNSGFITAYAPTVGDLNALATYMWTSDFETNLKKLFGDSPMSTIIGLGAVPVTPNVGASQHVILGNVDTEISMPIITNQYVKFDCGSIQISPKYGAFLDYEPYTSIDLYLPYIGMVQLSTNDVMGKSLSVKYIIDVISGACVAEVLCGGSVYYTFEGCCLSQFPISQDDYSNVFHAAVQAATSLAGGIAGAVAGGLTGNVAGAVNSAVQGIGGAAQAAMNAHPVVNRSGGLAGAGGMLTVQKPFIVMSTPKMVASNAQNAFIGYPIFATYRLSDLSGYTEVENINISGLYATQAEQDEIKMLLKNGVIL